MSGQLDVILADVARLEQAEMWPEGRGWQSAEGSRCSRSDVDPLRGRGCGSLMSRAVVVRRALLEDALNFYRGFLRQESTDPTIRAQTGLAYSRVGEISVYLLRPHSGTRSVHRQAVPRPEQQVWTSLRTSIPARTWTLLQPSTAEVFASAGRLEEAEQEHRRTLGQFEQVGCMQLSPGARTQPSARVGVHLREHGQGARP